MGVINYLIWIDQVNGAFLGVALFNKSILNLIPYPLASVLGSEFCDWIDLPGCIYLVGSFLWSSITALYRVLYIKCFRWMKRTVGNLFRSPLCFRLLVIVAQICMVGLGTWVLSYPYRLREPYQTLRRRKIPQLFIMPKRPRDQTDLIRSFIHPLADIFLSGLRFRWFDVHQ